MVKLTLSTTWSQTNICASSTLIHTCCKRSHFSMNTELEMKYHSLNKKRQESLPMVYAFGILPTEKSVLLLLVLPQHHMHWYGKDIAHILHLVMGPSLPDGFLVDWDVWGFIFDFTSMYHLLDRITVRYNTFHCSNIFLLIICCFWRQPLILVQYKTRRSGTQIFSAHADPSPSFVSHQ